MGAKMNISAYGSELAEETLVLVGEIYYEKGDDGAPVIHPPWLPPFWGRFYDLIMERWIFPGKFRGTSLKHDAYMKRQLSSARNQAVLEIGTGSGISAGWLDSSNRYRGIDISPALLSIAREKFTRRGFSDARFYAIDASRLPFQRDSFDLCLCILTLNFIEDERALFEKVHRLLHEQGEFICCVPVPERSNGSMKIRGTLRSENELQDTLNSCSFSFEPLPVSNGSLLYFKAVKR